MLIKPDTLGSIAIDEFTSTSGKYRFVLVGRSEGSMRGYYIIILVGDKIKKIVHMLSLGIDAPPTFRIALYDQWERIKDAMTAPAQEEESTLLGDLMNQKDYQDTGGEVKTKPRGARIFVRTITPVDEVTARAQAAGLEIVIDESRKPRATMGVVLAVGEDPLAMELYKEGDIVVFSPHAGVEIREEGNVYRSLELHEIIGVRDAEQSVNP